LNYTRAYQHRLVATAAGGVCAVFAQTSYRTR